MKRIFFAIILAAVLALPINVFAAGTVTQSYSKIYSSEGITNLAILTFSWTADSSDGSVPTTDTSTTITDQIAGKWIVKVVTNPGSTAPTDNYDITLTDADGVDVMGGTLADRDTANSEAAIPHTGSTSAGAYGPTPISGALTLTITNNSIHSATGTVVIYLSR